MTQTTLPEALAAIPCRACRSRQTVLRARFDLKGNPILECLSCGRSWNVRLVDVRR